MIYDLASIVNGNKEAERKQIDADLELQQTQELAAANMGRSRMAPRQSIAGGGRYQRRQVWTPGGGVSGLAKANSDAMAAARRKKAYADLEEKHRFRGFTSTLGAPIRIG